MLLLKIIATCAILNEFYYKINDSKENVEYD